MAFLQLTLEPHPKKLTLLASCEAAMDFQNSKYIKPITKLSTVNIVWGPNRPRNAVLGLKIYMCLHQQML